MQKIRLVTYHQLGLKAKCRHAWKGAKIEKIKKCASYRHCSANIMNLPELQ